MEINIFFDTDDAMDEKVLKELKEKLENALNTVNHRLVSLQKAKFNNYG